MNTKVSPIKKLAAEWVARAKTLRADGSLGARMEAVIYERSAEDLLAVVEDRPRAPAPVGAVPDGPRRDAVRERAAYEAGEVARREGRTHLSNPYSVEDYCFDAWFRGWLDAAPVNGG